MRCLRFRRTTRPLPLSWIAFSLLLGLASCSVRHTVRLSADDVQHFLSEKLPVSASKFLVTATIPSAQVEFIESENGVVVRPDVEVSVAGQRLLRGHALVSGQVRYDPPTGAFFLDQANVVAVTVEGLPDSVRPTVEEVVRRCIESYLTSQPLYRLDPSSFKQSLAKLVLKSVRVWNGRLEIVVGT